MKKILQNKFGRYETLFYICNRNLRKEKRDNKKLIYTTMKTNNLNMNLNTLTMVNTLCIRPCEGFDLFRKFVK